MRSLFGVSVMQRAAPEVEAATDYYFMTDRAWIVARIRDGAVMAWPVTVTDFKFKVKISDLTRGLVEGVQGTARSLRQDFPGHCQQRVAGIARESYEGFGIA